MSDTDPTACPHCAHLQQEIAQLRDALLSRDIIGQAKGILMAATGCTSDEAFVVLRAESQHTNRKLRQVAADLVAASDRKQAASVLVRDAADVARSDLQVLVRHEDAASVLVVRGDLDRTTAPALQRALAEWGDAEGELVVDLADLGFADLRGLAPVVRVARAGRVVRLRNAPRFLRRLLAMHHTPAALVVEAPVPTPAAGTP